MLKYYPGFLVDPGLKLIFFCGKGGVGKTTCSLATALYRAMKYPSQSILLFSIDPAHSLKDSLFGEQYPQNLTVREFDAHVGFFEFQKEHQEKIKQILLEATFFDEDDLNQFIDLTFPGLNELMAFLEIHRWIKTGDYDGIIIDTAPTGHLFQFLNMPNFLKRWLSFLEALSAKSHYIKQVFTDGRSAIEQEEILGQLELVLHELSSLLKNSEQCRFIPVMIAEGLSVQETTRLVERLSQYQIEVLDIIVNGVFRNKDCPLCLSRYINQKKILEILKEKKLFNSMALWGIPYVTRDKLRAGHLSQLWDGLSEEELTCSAAIKQSYYQDIVVEHSLPLPSNHLQLAIFAGKGGVGKTTLASASAIHFAQEHLASEVILLSIDPAHSLSGVFERDIGKDPVEVLSGLKVMEIDARSEFENLKQEYEQELEEFFQRFSSKTNLAFEQDILEQFLELSPPGLDEVMALVQALDFASIKEDRLLILDPAPTGHLLQVLQLPELMRRWLQGCFNLFLKYKNIFSFPRLQNRLVKLSRDIKDFSSLLQDDQSSLVYVVTILTQLAFEESKDLISFCDDHKISAPYILHNMVIPDQKDCDFCQSLRSEESEILDKYKQRFAQREHCLVFWGTEMQGMKRLQELGLQLYHNF